MARIDTFGILDGFFFGQKSPFFDGFRPPPAAWPDEEASKIAKKSNAKRRKRQTDSPPRDTNRSPSKRSAAHAGSARAIRFDESFL